MSNEVKIEINTIKLYLLFSVKLTKYFLLRISWINCVTPKIKKYKNLMRKNISKLCDISENQINIKGKTTEKLGVIGKEKAIACEVITSVIKYG